MQSLLPARRKNRRALDRAPRNNCRCRVLDRRADRGGLLAVPGASAYFSAARWSIRKPHVRHCSASAMPRCRACGPSTEAYSLLIARRVRERHGRDLGLGETGATGPTGNRYGDPAGHTLHGGRRPDRTRRSRCKPAAPTGGEHGRVRESARFAAGSSVASLGTPHPFVPAKAGIQGRTAIRKTKSIGFPRRG